MLKQNWENENWGYRIEKKGGTRKIRDIKPPCLHPEHNPPSHMVYQPGVYEHVCPGCGRRIEFTVNGVTCHA